MLIPVQTRTELKPEGGETAGSSSADALNRARVPRYRFLASKVSTQRLRCRWSLPISHLTLTTGSSPRLI